LSKVGRNARLYANSVAADVAKQVLVPLANGSEEIGTFTDILLHSKCY
jgi:hypothetical protein